MATTLKARLTKIEAENRKRYPKKERGCFVAYTGNSDCPDGMWQVGDEILSLAEVKQMAKGKTLVLVEYADDAED